MWGTTILDVVSHALHLLPKDCNIKVMCTCIWLKVACDQRTPALACMNFNSWELPETNRMTDPSLRALWVTGQVYRYPRVLLRGLQYNGMDRLLSIKDVVESKLGIWLTVWCQLGVFKHGNYLFRSDTLIIHYQRKEGATGRYCNDHLGHGKGTQNTKGDRQTVGVPDTWTQQNNQEIRPKGVVYRQNNQGGGSGWEAVNSGCCTSWTWHDKPPAEMVGYQSIVFATKTLTQKNKPLLSQIIPFPMSLYSTQPIANLSCTKSQY